MSLHGSDGNYRVRMKGFAPSLVGTIPIGPVELFGKVGEYFYNVDSRIDLDGAGSPRITSSHSRTDLLWGGGVGITVLEHLNLRAEYERIEIDNAKDSNALWLGAAWRF
ncbi:MAG: outer membrane beta-barrel protein [Steroidobacteraceae bacterium]